MAEQTPKKQHTMEYVAIGALVAAALIIGVIRFKKSDTNDEVFSRKEFNEKWKEVEILEARVPKNEKEVAYTVEGDVFPFKSPFDDEAAEKPEEEENVTLPAMQFQGMLWKGPRPQAIINNKIYDIKDAINTGNGTEEENVIVKDITSDGIHLMYKHKEFIVRPK